MGKLTYGGTGVSYECRKVDMSTGGAPKCPRCQERVYFNEEKKALGKSWHTKCFTCAKCGKSLSSSNSANHEDEIFCVACHRKNFGPKGYGFAGGAAGLSTEAPAIHQRQPSSTSETSSVAQRAVPAGCQSEVNDTMMVPISKATQEKFNSTLASGDMCPRCHKRVYFAEEVRVGLKKWHKLCFKCDQCNKLLEASRVNEHEGSQFCQSCYGKKFGPKGYGFAGGAATMMSSERTETVPYSGKTSAPRTHSPYMNGSQEWTEPINI